MLPGHFSLHYVLSSRGHTPSQILSDCVYTWERTVMGISVHTAGTEMATTPYYSCTTNHTRRRRQQYNWQPHGVGCPLQCVALSSTASMRHLAQSALPLAGGAASILCEYGSARAFWRVEKRMRICSLLRAHLSERSWVFDSRHIPHGKYLLYSVFTSCGLPCTLRSLKRSRKAGS